MTSIFTIGHSTLEYPAFLRRLREAGVTAIADVRTSPFSRVFPHYNREDLRGALASDGVAYVFLGKELGGRPSGAAYYTDGVADYEKMATAPLFSSGLERLEKGARKYRLALMCSERNPLDCHRCLLVGRALSHRQHDVEHIVSDNECVSQNQIESQLLALAGKEHDDMFAPPLERLNEAYKKRSQKVAFADIHPSSLDAAIAE